MKFETESNTISVFGKPEELRILQIFLSVYSIDSIENLNNFDYQHPLDFFHLFVDIFNISLDDLSESKMYQAKICSTCNNLKEDNLKPRSDVKLFNRMVNEFDVMSLTDPGYHSRNYFMSKCECKEEVGLIIKSKYKSILEILQTFLYYFPSYILKLLVGKPIPQRIRDQIKHTINDIYFPLVISDLDHFKQIGNLFDCGNLETVQNGPEMRFVEQSQHIKCYKENGIDCLEYISSYDNLFMEAEWCLDRVNPYSFGLSMQQDDMKDKKFLRRAERFGISYAPSKKNVVTFAMNSELGIYNPKIAKEIDSLIPEDSDTVPRDKLINYETEIQFKKYLARRHRKRKV